VTRQRGKAPSAFLVALSFPLANFLGDIRLAQCPKTNRWFK
jgi:hypothetical protein